MRADSKYYINKTAPEMFSACLLIKDDNEILNEWIAYHYHTLNLRHIVVATDPSSETSPSELLQRWRHAFGHTNLTIEEWTDQKYMPDYFLQKEYDKVPNLLGSNNNSNDTNNEWGLSFDASNSTTTATQVSSSLVQINNHRFRQLEFLRNCIIHLKRQKRHWMMHIDTDEFVVINPLLRRPQERQQRQEDVHVLPTSIPNTPEALSAGSLLHFLQQATRSLPIQYPCLSLPRVLFGSVERRSRHSNNNNNHNSENNKFHWNRPQFETLRWKFHAPLSTQSSSSFKGNGLPKTILDLMGILPKDKKRLWERVFSIHRPSVKLCQNQDTVNFVPALEHPLTLNHYLGSWKRFSARQDPRRNAKKYHAKANVTDGQDDEWIDSWLEQFVQEHGLERVSMVLRDYRRAASTT